MESHSAIVVLSVVSYEFYVMSTVHVYLLIDHFKIANSFEDVQYKMCGKGFNYKVYTLIVGLVKLVKL